MDPERVIDETADGRLFTQRTRRASPESFAWGMMNVALQALSARALVWTAALGAGGAWGYTITMGADTPRIVASALATLTVLGPILWRDSRG